MRKAIGIKENLTVKIYIDCLRAEWLPLLLYILSENLGSLVSVYTAGVLGQFADAVFRLDAGAGFESLWQLALCLGITVLLLPALDCVAQMVELSYALAYDRVVLRRFLKKEPQAVEGFTAGEMLQRLDTDPIALRCGVCRILSGLVYVVVTTAVLLARALSVSPLFTAVMLLVTALKLTVPLAVRKLEGRYDREERAYGDSVRSVEGEITSEPWRIPLLGMAAPFCHRLEVLFRAHMAKTASASIRCRQIAGGISGFLDTFCTVVLLASGALLTALGQITPGVVAAMFGYYGICGGVVSTLAETIQHLPKMKNTRERMLFFYRDPESAEGEQPSSLAALTAEGLSFRLGEKELLPSHSFRLEAGEKVVLTGRNGCGKSTCLRLLAGLWRGYDGSIRVHPAPESTSSAELSAISPGAWRRLIAYAPQDPVIFGGTVRDNILSSGEAGQASLSEADLEALLAGLGLTAIADRVIPCGGAGLSGGEKQKISLARALARRTPLLLLDEPGNDLDPESLLWLSAWLRRTPQTVLCISHDPQLIAAATRCLSW